MRGQPVIVKQLLTKAKDSALLAVEFYNKPAVSFKSEGFITMMIVAWTALFHAWFIKNKIKPYYRKHNNKSKKKRFEVIEEKLPNGKIIKQKRWWDISECIRQYFKDSDPPQRKNLEFFVQLRNMIVHRSLPELDDSIYGECQSLLINFNNFIESNFGQKYSIKNSLSYSLQLSESPKNFLEFSKDELKKRNAVEVVEYIKAFRTSLSSDILESPEYSFKAILIQVKNHASKDALPIKFIHEKDLNEEQKQQLTNMGVVLVKEKEIIKDDIPAGFLTYTELVQKLKEAISSIKINNEFHKVRKDISLKNPSLIHKRKLDPRNNKSTEKTFYNPKIIEEIRKYYNS